MTIDPVAQPADAPDPGAIPEWTLGWRLQRSLAHAEMRAEDMATEVGVARATVSRWMHDKGAPPRAIYLKHWALRTGVPFEWIESGSVTSGPGNGDRPDTASAGGDGSGFYTPRCPTASSLVDVTSPLADVLPLRYLDVSAGNGSSRGVGGHTSARVTRSSGVGTGNNGFAA